MHAACMHGCENGGIKNNIATLSGIKGDNSIQPNNIITNSEGPTEMSIVVQVSLVYKFHVKIRTWETNRCTEQ